MENDNAYARNSVTETNGSGSETHSGSVETVNEVSAFDNMELREVDADGKFTITLNVENFVLCGEEFTAYFVEKDDLGRLIKLDELRITGDGDDQALTLADYNASNNYVLYVWIPKETGEHLHDG